ncbi:MAG: endonuclease/exonuclease/phosphatase family protein [Gammaproteobacteria bacterium]|nr:endonuclease/exonuclease/phosphatase family protein [Gammaproteobacteria bacterium]
MRFVLYNIRYATGSGRHHLPFPGFGYLRRTHHRLDRLTEFLTSLDPDIIGLVEVDLGSYRTSTRRGLPANQAETIANALGHSHVYSCKYDRRSFNNRLPVLGKQGNAFITGHSIAAEKFHYFSRGVKRLIIELELESFCVFLVHLSLGYRDRQQQLRDLQELIDQSDKPVIVAGDFNTFFGEAELYAFLSRTGLRSANRLAQATFPSHVPRRQLDFIFHDPSITVSDFFIPDVQLSDHLPLVIDFDAPAP